MQNEPSHGGMVLFVLRKVIFQTRMRSHPMGLDVWFSVGPFVYFPTSCARTAKALARLHGIAGSPGPSLVAYVISTIISWAGSNMESKKISNDQKWSLFWNLSWQGTGNDKQCNWFPQRDQEKEAVLNFKYLGSITCNNQSSTFIYACKSWTLTEELERRLQTLKIGCYRRPLNISYKDHMTNEGLQQDPGCHWSAF